MTPRHVVPAGGHRVATRHAPVIAAADLALSEVSSTLLIPLTARALGDAMFPAVANHDACAPTALRRLQVDVTAYVADPYSLYGVLARTLKVRELAAAFFAAHPTALGVNLGCGLSHYFQWLDAGRNQWLDADLPSVMALRDRVLDLGAESASARSRHRFASVDLRDPGWWSQLELPATPHGEPLLLLLEGVLMYLQPAQVHALLHNFGAHAPTGSQLVFDALCWLVVGHADMHPSVRHTGAEFCWGPQRSADLTRAHPRLRLRSEHDIMAGMSWPLAVFGSGFRALTGLCPYGIVQLEVAD